MWHQFGALLGAVLLVGCADSGGGGNEESPPTSENGSGDAAPITERFAMAETAWLSVSQDGAVFTTFLDANGGYRDLRNGELAFVGVWKQDAQGQLCFTPEEGTASCWSHGAPGADGTMRATDEEGRSIELKRISYDPPAATPTAEGGTEESLAAPQEG